MFTHHGTLKNGRHYIQVLDKWFVAGDDVPLTEADVAAFSDKFNSISLLDEEISIEEAKPPADDTPVDAGKKPAGKGKTSTSKK